MTVLQNQLTVAQNSRQTVVVEINNKTEIVEDLRRKLLIAEKELADAKIRLCTIDEIIASLPNKILVVQKELAELVVRAKSCADQIIVIQATIDGLKGSKYPEITGQITALDGKISVSRTTITEIEAQIAASLGPLEDLKSKLVQAQQDLNFIKTQKVEIDVTLRQAYQRGNDANTRVAYARQNLDAVIARFQSESKIVSEATLNLERARAE